MKLVACLWLAWAVPLAAADIAELRYKLSAGDLSSADALAADFCAEKGERSPECAAAEGWLARGSLLLGQPAETAQYLVLTKALTTALLKKTTVDENRFLMSAVGNTIETEARLLVVEGKRDKAIAELQAELARWKPFALRARIQKNIDLLTLEGKAAPQLDQQYRGKPVLLFLWAHWCADCKAQAPTLGRIHKKYAGRGLVMLAPTRLYGSVGDLENAPREKEVQEIEKVWKDSYADLPDVAHPVDEDAMFQYGVSSTPTLVLIDRKGIVRMYRPYRMSEAALNKEIEAVLPALQ